MFETHALEHQPSLNVRLGILLKRNNRPSRHDRELFFSKFGDRHCFVVRSRMRGFKVFSSSGVDRLPCESLPVDYLYAPDNWERRLTDDQIRNVLLSLRHLPNDFLIISSSLSEFPLIEVSSIRNHTIFSKELGLDFPGQRPRPAKGKLLRLPPYDHPVSEV